MLNMGESSSSRPAQASNLQSILLQRIACVKNEQLAQAINTDKAHVSHFTSGERGLRIHQLEPFLKELGLRVIECDGPTTTIPSKEWSALCVLAEKYFK